MPAARGSGDDHSASPSDQAKPLGAPNGPKNKQTEAVCQPREGLAMNILEVCEEVALLCVLFCGILYTVGDDPAKVGDAWQAFGNRR